MENISKHIEKLLAQNDYVIVPDLGGFVVQTESAQILPDMIIPPMMTVAFNPLMLHADGLLAIEVSRSEQINYRNAVEYIRSEVERIKKQLAANKKIELGNMGYLYQTPDQSLIFAPSERADFLPGNFQMSDLYVQSRHLQLKPAGQSNKSIKIEIPKYRIYKYAAVAMVALGLFFTSNKVNDSRLNNSASLVPTINIPSKYLTSVSDKKVVEDTVSEMVNDSPKVENVDKGVKPVVVRDSVSKESAGRFYVVVASLASKESADDYCKELRRDYPSSCVVASHKVYRTAVKSFDKQSDALVYMQKLRKTDERFEEAWVVNK